MLDYLKNINIKNPLWLSVSEAAKLGGVKDKTIRRALKAENYKLKFKISNNRYQIELSSLLIYLHHNKKLKNKLFQFGLGQYWPKEK